MAQPQKSNIQMVGTESEKLRSDVGPFAIVPTWLLESNLSDRAIRLYAILAKHANRDDQTAFPSRRTLARLIHCTLKRVDAAKRELIDIGAITSEERYHQLGGQTSNLYTLRLSKPDGVKTAPPPRVGKRPSPPGSLFNPPPGSENDPPPGSENDPPRTRNIGTRTSDQERTPPNPLAGGRPSTRKPSKAEHDWASRVLATYRTGCPHEPSCDTRAKCIGKLVMFHRQQTLEGMTEEMNA